MKRSTLVTVLIVLLVVSLSTGVLASRGISILGLTVATEEGNGEFDEGDNGLKENEGDPEGLPESDENGDDEDEIGGARALFPDLHGHDFGQAISELARSYPGAVADAVLANKGKVRGLPEHAGTDENGDKDENGFEAESQSTQGRGKPAWAGKPPHAR